MISFEKKLKYSKQKINNIYSKEELDKNSTCQNFRQVQKEGNRNVARENPFYNLELNE